MRALVARQFNLATTPAAGPGAVPNWCPPGGKRASHAHDPTLVAQQTAEGDALAGGEILPHDRTVWDHVGIAYVNQDGSINVQLRAIPLAEKLQLRK